MSNIITRFRPYAQNFDYLSGSKIHNFSIIYMYITQYIHTVYNVYTLQLERQFEQALKKSRGMVIHRMKPDGACLFRAVGQSTPTHSYCL